MPMLQPPIDAEAGGFGQDLPAHRAKGREIARLDQRAVDCDEIPDCLAEVLLDPGELAVPGACNGITSAAIASSSV